MSDFDDESTPPKGKIMRPLTDSERQVFAAQWDSSHKGVVRGEFEDEETSPIDLFERDPKDAEEAIIRHLRRDPKRLIEYVGKIAAKAQHLSQEFRRRIVHESSENQKQLEELRDLLSRPPNGATKRLEDQVRGLTTAITAVSERLEEIERRVAPVEDTIRSVKGLGWKAALAVVTTIAGSAVAIITSWQAKAEKEGAAAERSANDRRRLDRLEQRDDERPRPPRRDYDYDYDIQPRHEPAAPKKEP